MTKRPVGLMNIFVLSSIMSAGNDLADNILFDVAAKRLGLDICGVLRGYDNSVDSYRSAVLGIFDRDLSFSVGSEIGESAVRADFRQLSGETYGRAEMGRGISSGVSAARIAEHHSLVARALTVNAEGDVGDCLSIVVSIAQVWPSSPFRGCRSRCRR